MDVGFNFRATLGFVSDPANTYAVLAEAYPNTYVAGVVGGWTSVAPVGSDTDSSFNARIAGINYGPGGTATFRFDLPSAGDYQIGLAFGGSNQNGSTLLIKDNATTKLTIGSHNLTLGNFYDGADVQYSAANWPASNSLSASLTFASTILIVNITCATNPVIAHLRIVSAGGGGGVVTNAGRCGLLGVGN